MHAAIRVLVLVSLALAIPAAAAQAMDFSAWAPAVQGTAESSWPKPLTEVLEIEPALVAFDSAQILHARCNDHFQRGAPRTAWAFSRFSQQGGEAVQQILAEGKTFGSHLPKHCVGRCPLLVIRS
jgi:hypothetical protein